MLTRCSCGKFNNTLKRKICRNCYKNIDIEGEEQRSESMLERILIRKYWKEVGSKRLDKLIKESYG